MPQSRHGWHTGVPMRLAPAHSRTSGNPVFTKKAGSPLEPVLGPTRGWTRVRGRAEMRGTRHSGPARKRSWSLSSGRASRTR